MREREKVKICYEYRAHPVDTFMYNRIYTVPVSLNVNTVLFFNIAFNEVKKLRYFGKILATFLSLNCICSNFLL